MGQKNDAAPAGLECNILTAVAFLCTGIPWLPALINTQQVLLTREFCFQILDPGI